MPDQPFVYFDLGMVLVEFDHQIAVEQLAELTSQPSDRVNQVLFHSDLQNRYETGLVSSSEFAAEIRNELQSDAPDEQILEAISAIFQPNEFIVPVLEMLRDKDVPMAILSNTCEAHWLWILKQNWFVPGNWFEYHVLSYEVKCMKPDVGIYQTCEERSGRSASNLFFTDDKPENTAAARERGWTTHTYLTTQPLLDDLNRWLDRP